MSSVYPIINNSKFSYKVNNELTTMTNAPSAPYYITVTSLNDVRMILTPYSLNNIKWTNIMSYDLEIKNLSSSPIDNFSVRLNLPENLSYINGTLVNSRTGQYYPLKDWENEFDILDTLPASSSLNVKYSIQINPNSGTTVINPVEFFNSGSLGSNTDFDVSNTSSLNVSEPKIIYDNANYTLQNTGAIPYSFTYKFTIPTGKTYKYAILDSTVFTNIVYRQLASYAIFTITSLPPMTSTAPNLLSIIFE